MLLTLVIRFNIFFHNFSQTFKVHETVNAFLTCSTLSNDEEGASLSLKYGIMGRGGD